MDKLKDIRKRASRAFTIRSASLADLTSKHRRTLDLCDHCQGWHDPAHVFRSPFTQLHDHEGVLFVSMREMQANNCYMCRLVSKASEAKLALIDSSPEAASRAAIHVGTAFTLPPESMIKSCKAYDLPDMRDLSRMPGDQCIRCIVNVKIHANSLDTPRPSGPKVSTYMPQSSFAIPLLLSFGKNQSGLVSAEIWDDEYMHMSRVNAWLSHCKHKHVDEIRRTPRIDLAGFRLIDTKRMAVVLVPKPVEYVALSYMWRSTSGAKDVQLLKSNTQALQETNSLQLENLPEVIGDSIRFCSILGTRYLWVDRLCIVQDDPATKTPQIQAMDKIYGAAFLTIAAVASGVGLPGVIGRPRQSFIHNGTRRFNAESNTMESNFSEMVDSSPWNDRGWTFQERVISPRCLYITDFQVYFSCRHDLYQEDIGIIQRAWEGVQGVHSLNISSTPTVHYRHYVEHYSARKLSFQEDILNAFAGVANVLSEQIKTPFLFGIPEAFLNELVLWRANGPGRREDALGIPSWSWASWNGPVKFSHVYTSDFGSLVQYHLLDGKKRTVRRINTSMRWFGITWYFANEQSVPDLNHKFMPSTKVENSVWISCPHNPWESLKHLPIDVEEIFARGVGFGGCLVFNTTVASLSLRPYIKEVEKDNNDSDEDEDDGDGIDESDDDDDGKMALQRYHLCNEAGIEIGRMKVLPDTIHNIDTQNAHTFIVLAAGLIRKQNRSDIFFNVMASRSGDQAPLRKVFILKVMMVEAWKGVYRRVALATVEADMWRLAEPTWETVVLA